jgi:hypothetical protein
MGGEVVPRIYLVGFPTALSARAKFQQQNLKTNCGTNINGHTIRRAANVYGRLFRGDTQDFTFFMVLAFFAAQPCLEPIEIKIDHGRREQRQRLAEC